MQKIIEKHLNDFETFNGKTAYEKLENAINEIVENGKLISENGVNTIYLKKDNDIFLIGISKGWYNKGENKWIVTSYKKTKGKIPGKIKGDTANLSAYSDEFNPLLTSKDEPLNSSAIIPEKINKTTPPIKNQLEQAKQERQKKLEAAKKKELAEKELKEQRAQTKEMLKPYTHNKITNKNDNTQAVLTNKGIAEMLSSKAIAQSVNNGFTQAQHIKAVQNIKELFTEAIYKETQEPRHPKNDVLAYRIYNASFDNANAIISVQERKINDDVVYFMKLENLEPRANTRALTSTPSIETKVDNRAQRQSLPSLESAQDSTTKTFNQDDIKLEQAEPTPPQSTKPTIAQKLESKESNHHAQREQTKAILESLINKPITNQNDGRVAQISRKNIAKMTSDKAVTKSVANGFEPAEHFKAVQEVDKLYQNAVFKQSEKDPKNNDPALIIHRYNAELDNANALITIKESVDKDQNRIYSLELESLEPKLSTKIHENEHNALDSSVSKDFDTSVDSNMSLNTAQDSTTKTFNQDAIKLESSTQEKPKWSRADSKKWKLAKLKQTKAAAKKLYEQLQPIYNQARPLLIQAQKLKYTDEAQKLRAKARELIEQESKPFIKKLEQHELEIDRTAFTLYPETANIKIQPKRNYNLEWKNKKRGEQGFKGAAKYRAQALQRLSEKDYMTPFEQATKAKNPLTSLHALKFEILKDLNKAKAYIDQQGYDKDLSKTYRDYVNRTSSDLDSIEQSIRKLKSNIQPKPQRVQEVRTKVQDFIKWRDEVGFDTNYLLTLESDGARHALEYLETKLQAATLPQQVSFIKQLKEQIKEHFSTTPKEPAQDIPQTIKDIIDSSPEKGRDMQIIGETNFTPQVVEYAHKNNKKVAIDKLDEAEATKLGFKYPKDTRVTIDYQAINHTLNRHGAESTLVKNSGQKAVDYTDIAEYRNIVKNADESLESVDNLGQSVIVSFKQINGHAAVVESIRKKGNELAFKSMYFENGGYKNSNAYKNAVENPKGNPSPAPYGYEPHADANTPPKVDTEHYTTKTFNQEQLAKLKETYNHAMTTGLENAKKDLELRKRAGVTFSDEQDYLMRKAKPQTFKDLEIEYFNKMGELPKEVQEMLAAFPKNKTIRDAEKIKPYKTDSDYINAVKQEMLEKYKDNNSVQVSSKIHREVDEIAKNIALSEKKNKYGIKANQKKEAREKATLQLRKDLMAGNNYDEIARLSSENFLKKTRENIETDIVISYSNTIKEFGTNYAEHYHSGETAIQKLIAEAKAHKQSGGQGEYKGQVAGAFCRDDIGDITLAWGEKGTGKSDGWGLSKIVEYHPEVLDKLDKLIQDLPIVKETENRYKLDNGDFFISIRKDFGGQKQNWVLTALERDESIARRRTDLPSSQGEAEKTTSANASVDSTTKTFNQDDIKLESLQDFASYARLAGFENLSPREQESAHKHILANLEKLRC